MATTSPVLEIFVDEAGDLGFGERASKHFVIAYVIPDQPQRIRREVVKLMKNLRQYHRVRLLELKHSDDSRLVRGMAIKMIVGLGFKAGVVAIDKAYVKPELKDKKLVLYNFLIADNIATSALQLAPGSVRMVLDRSMSKEAVDLFNDYFRRKIGWRSAENGASEPRVTVEHLNSRDDKCLQVADYLAGACYLKFERGDANEYELLKPKIVFTKGWGSIEW